MNETPQLHPALLPAGLRDILPPEAELEARSVETIMDCFASHGYQRVEPPLLEFEDSLFSRLRRRRSGEQAVLEFEKRRFDPLITVAAKQSMIAATERASSSASGGSTSRRPREKGRVELWRLVHGNRKGGAAL